MKRYEDYQTVSSLWVDSLPTHWEFSKLRSIFWQRKEKNDPVKTKEILSLSAKAAVATKQKMILQSTILLTKET